MKKLFFIAALFVLAVSSTCFAQDSATQSQTPQLLSLYYNIKDALVTGNASVASAKAQDFVNAANGGDNKSLPANSITDLIKDASGIAGTKDITHQREYFAGLSSSMSAVIKAVKLTDQPVYQVYCPMKKTYWLNSDKTIRNPYFGSAMLTCGKVTATL